VIVCLRGVPAAQTLPVRKEDSHFVEVTEVPDLSMKEWARDDPSHDPLVSTLPIPEFGVVPLTGMQVRLHARRFGRAACEGHGHGSFSRCSLSPSIDRKVSHKADRVSR
jgi:hypothetical protein